MKDTTYRLLFVGRAYYPAVRYGGPVETFHRICSRLALMGHHVSVVCSNMASPGRRGESVPAGRYLVDGVRVHYLRTPIRFHWEGISVGAFRALRHSVAQSDAVLIMGTRHYLGMIAGFLCRRYGKPYLLYPEGSVPPRYRNIGPKILLDRLDTRRSFRRASKIIVASSDESEEVRRWGGLAEDKVVLLPMRAEAPPETSVPRDRLRQRWGIPAGAPVLLWIGRIHPEKGLQVLFQALEDDRLESCHLIVAGDAEHKGLQKRLAEWADRAPLAGRIHFVGWVGPSEKAELMKLSDLFVLPSRKESFGLAAGEAVAAGLPAIVTEGTGIASLLHAGAGLVTAFDPRSLADAIAAPLQDEGLLDRLRAETKEAARKLDWSWTVQSVEATYQEILARR
jgi:glycosyltransferase involved in cell wall biosynthesis